MRSKRRPVTSGAPAERTGKGTHKRADCRTGQIIFCQKNEHCLRAVPYIVEMHATGNSDIQIQPADGMSRVTISSIVLPWVGLLTAGASSHADSAAALE